VGFLYFESKTDTYKYRLVFEHLGDVTLSPDPRYGRLIAWRKRSYRITNGECVEMTNLSDTGIGIRDSRDPDEPVLEFTLDERKLSSARTAKVSLTLPGNSADVPPPSGPLVSRGMAQRRSHDGNLHGLLRVRLV